MIGWRGSNGSLFDPRKLKGAIMSVQNWPRGRLGNEGRVGDGREKKGVEKVRRMALKEG